MRVTTLHLSLLLAPALFLSACAGSGGRAHAKEPRVQRETALQSTWRGRPFDVLLDAFGDPELYMDIPAYRLFPTFVVVYSEKDSVSKCIDAFTIVSAPRSNEWFVMDYFCR